MLFVDINIKHSNLTYFNKNRIESKNIGQNNFGCIGLKQYGTHYILIKTLTKTKAILQC